MSGLVWLYRGYVLLYSLPSLLNGDGFPGLSRTPQELALCVEAWKQDAQRSVSLESSGFLGE